jgi:hypothetical protein
MKNKCIICKNPVKSRKKETKYCSYKCRGLHDRESGNPNYKGGKRLAAGYKMMLMPYSKRQGWKKYMQEHRLVMEKNLGRKLKSFEVIHHINGNKLDNHIKNLVLTTNSAHRKLHNQTIKRDTKGKYINSHHKL